MSAAYLEWLKDVLEEAQVPHTEATSEYLDQAFRRLSRTEGKPEAEVLATVRRRWLRLGPSGRQLLAGLLRDEVYARRDSPFRPQEGMGYYTNAELER